MTTRSPAPTPSPSPSPTTPPPDGPISEHTILLFTMLGTVATAAFTLVLAIFAICAWCASKNSVNMMRAQVKATARAAAKQVKDQTLGRQMDALARFLELILELRHARLSAPSDVAILFDSERENPASKRWEENNRVRRELEGAGKVWRLLHPDEASATELLQTAEKAILEAFFASVKGEVRAHNAKSALAYMAKAVPEWQNSKKKLEKARDIEADVRDILEKTYDKKRH